MEAKREKEIINKKNLKKTYLPMLLKNAWRHL